MGSMTLPAKVVTVVSLVLMLAFGVALGYVIADPDERGSYMSPRMMSGSMGSMGMGDMGMGDMDWGDMGPGHMRGMDVDDMKAMHDWMMGSGGTRFGPRPGMGPMHGDD